VAIRIAFDIDGVLADFAAAFREVELRLFGPASAVGFERPEIEAEHEEAVAARATAEAVRPVDGRRRRDVIWKAIRETPDFWTLLKPLDPTAVARIHEMMVRKRWEVVFITQRPSTAGQTVQRQTQVWLRDQGFEMPSVLVIAGSRGAAAAALRLNFHVDDNPQNCLDIVADSKARAFLIVPEGDEVTEKAARRLGVAVARSVGEVLDLLGELPNSGNPDAGILERLARMIGWK